MRKIFIHEDDQCQTEILPSSDRRRCESIFQEIEQRFGNSSHVNTQGLEPSDSSETHIQRDQLADLKIPIRAITDMLENQVLQYDVVETGTFTDRDVCKNTIALGNDISVTVFIEHSPEQIVESLYFQLAIEVWNECSPLEMLFCSLGQLYDLIFVDWPKCKLFCLRDTIAMNRYFEEDIRGDW
ncbi:MAG: hypothetical protein DHS20C16_19920 [Phycisphaerae bacterium]|nr:MAG: hypothetical protein DHS20C16_19920 [Phycisphaerae bacterium]